MNTMFRKPNRAARANLRRGLAWFSALLIVFISSQYAVAGPWMLARSGAMDLLNCIKHQQGFLSALKHDHRDHGTPVRHDHLDCLMCFAPPIVDGSPEIITVTRAGVVPISSLKLLKAVHVQPEHHGVVASRAPPAE
jgi:hypothetical protein